MGCCDAFLFFTRISQSVVLRPESSKVLVKNTISCAISELMNKITWAGTEGSEFLRGTSRGFSKYEVWNCWLRAWRWLDHNYIYTTMRAWFSPIFHLLYNEILYGSHQHTLILQNFLCIPKLGFCKSADENIKSYYIMELPSSQQLCFTRVNFFVYTILLVYLWEYYCIHPICSKRI